MKLYRLFFVMYLLIIAIAVGSFAATAITKNKATKGTTQLNGDQAKIGTTYTLGKKEPINITLNSAEYTVERVQFGDELVIPKKNQKLLVLHYTLHNPNKKDFNVYWATLKFTVVDANDTNWKYCEKVGVEATKAKASMDLKPAQKAQFYTVIAVPANGEMPKLIIESQDRLVLRYDLRGQVKKLPAPIADPNDSTGATALEEVPAEIGTFYPGSAYDIKLDSVKFTTDAIDGKEPKSGKRYIVFVMTAKNKAPKAEWMRWNRIEPKLIDQDGGEFRWNEKCFYPSRDDNVNADVQPEKEIRFRYYFEVPEDLNMQALSLTELKTRTYVYDLTNVE